MAQVHETFTDVAGVICGSAFATTCPQVSSASPYSRTTDVILLGLVILAWKVIPFGKSRVGWLFVTSAAGRAETECTGRSEIVMTIRNAVNLLCMTFLLSAVSVFTNAREVDHQIVLQ